MEIKLAFIEKNFHERDLRKDFQIKLNCLKKLIGERWTVGAGEPEYVTC